MRLDLGHDSSLLDVISNIVHLLNYVVRELILHHGEQGGVRPEGSAVILGR